MRAHEGHDHDKPPPLNLPVAPRVVAVTPDFELVGVLSGKERLTIFLHSFATNEPIKGAKITLTAGDKTADAAPQSDGVFTVSAPWLAASEATDLVFSLTLADGSQDLLAGQLQLLSAATQVVAQAKPPTASLTGTVAWARQRPEIVVAVIAGLMVGVLLTLLLVGARRRKPSSPGTDIRDGALATAEPDTKIAPAGEVSVTPLRRSAAVVAVVAILAVVAEWSSLAAARAAEPATVVLPSVPATMATDLAQRMPDSTLFVPKATQHLLSVRTMLTAPGSAPRSIELTGAVIAGPEHFGRVQPGRPGRIEAAPGGLAYIGKRVEKGQVLAYVKTYVEAADKANMDSVIAETEARILKNRTILSRYEQRPGAVPQVRVDEVRGELDALTRKRAELVPSAGAREPILAPISGVVSVANATIGQIVEGRDILFEIVDPSQFWVEAMAHDAGVAKGLEKAYAVAGQADQIPLEFAGRGLALRQQTSILTFRVTGRHEELSVGMPVKVVLQSTAKVDGFILPASAIVRGATGLPIVWVKTEPERFEPLTVKVEPLDGRSVVVVAGLKVDMRVVTEGVTLLNQVR